MDNVGESGTSASIQDNGCLKCEWSIADLDQTNVVRLSALYQLPFGPHQQFVSHGLLGHTPWRLGAWRHLPVQHGSAPFPHIAGTVGFSRLRLADAPDAGSR